MRLIDADYLYNKLVANKCPYDLVLQMVKDESTVEVLEQIRDEIEQNIPLNDGIEGYNTGYAQGIQKALQIIDKYR
jgi:hypothetical protein